MTSGSSMLGEHFHLAWKRPAMFADVFEFAEAKPNIRTDVHSLGIRAITHRLPFGVLWKPRARLSFNPRTDKVQVPTKEWFFRRGLP